jgi:hypothetical protein
MTAVRPENAGIAQAVNAGMTAEASHMQWAETMQATIAGSEVAVEVPSTPDDVAATWPGGRRP